MYRFSLKILSILFCISFFSSCKDKDQPDDPCDFDFEATEVSVNLSVDHSLLPFRDVVVEDDGDENSATRGDGIWRLRYSLCAYRNNDSKPVAQTSSLSPKMKLYLPPGKYRLIAWADFVDSETERSQYFFTDDFTDILLKDKYCYSGTDPYKKGLVGEMDIRASLKTPLASIQLTPATAQYRLTASDKPDYKVGKVVISYPDGVPASLNLLTGKISHNFSGISFIHDSNPYLAMDNVLAENVENTLVVKVEVYDQQGKLRSRRNSIKIPYRRGGITNVSAKIYSVLEGNSSSSNEGGAGINGKYDDTIIIQI